MNAIIAACHWLRHGHLPRWTKCHYDFLTFDWCCVVCDPPA